MAILIINMFDSECGECGRSASPYDEAHNERLGYTPGEGCHAVWTHVSSHYVGPSQEAAVKALRPDLIWVDPFQVDPPRRLTPTP